ncbi:MAG: hypothetical protein QOJ35_1880 [Solirubrobacteraceae bacterium]|jgi:hypothetical protein|nr:hypothetical protein [Solirubrobacteraceae bacterium]
MSPRGIGVVQVVTAALALILVGVGLWALIAPHGFYAQAATYPPYNRHLVHDVGAFALGLGACLAAGLLMRDALLAVLAGNAAGAVAHVVGHVVDRGQGGRASDPITFGVVALVLVALTVVRWTQASTAAGR